MAKRRLTEFPRISESISKIEKNFKPDRKMNKLVRIVSNTNFLVFLGTVGMVLSSVISNLNAIPLFARAYKLRCSSCHMLPPKVNKSGDQFVMSGYSLETQPAHPKLPISVWISQRTEHDVRNDRTKGFPNRVELISAGPLSSWGSYFIEWVVVSYQLQADGRLLNRSGRFEDLWLAINLSPWTFQGGQFRSLTQVDLSRRLSLSEPLNFSGSVAGKKALDKRISSLRSFSPSGRSPALRVAGFWGTPGQVQNGWSAQFTVPFPGEFVIPLGSEVKDKQDFALEGIPKGAFGELFYKYELSSFGFNGFAGEDRWIAQAVGTYQWSKFLLTGAGGWAKDMKGQIRRGTLEIEYFPVRRGMIGSRIEDQSGPGNPKSLYWYLNFAFPLTSYTFRATVEERIRTGANLWQFEFALIF